MTDPIELYIAVVVSILFVMALFVKDPTCRVCADRDQAATDVIDDLPNGPAPFEKGCRVITDGPETAPTPPDGPSASANVPAKPKRSRSKKTPARKKTARKASTKATARRQRHSLK